MKIALIQLHATADKNENLEKAVAMIKKASGKSASFVLLPEVFIYRGKLPQPSVAENISLDQRKKNNSTVLALSNLAKQLKIYILAGSILERSKKKDKYYNTSILFDSNGRITAKYQKINLFGAQLGRNKLQESKNFLAGGKFVSVKVNEFNLGLSICFDLRFPEIYREYFRKNVNVICVPSAFTKKTGQAHWEILLRARAIENQAYVLAPNQVGTDHRGIESYGNSMVVDPWGKVLARGSNNKEEVVYADISLSEVKKAKKILPIRK